MSLKRFVFAVSFGFIASGTCADPDISEHVVKKSRSNYCHYQTSDFYNKTKRYTPYQTLGECLNSGGMIPPVSDHDAEPPVKFSSNRICHRKGGEWYEATKNHVAFESLEACINHGGRQPHTQDQL